MARKRNSSRPTIEQVKAAQSSKLMAIEGVVGVGIEEDDDGEAFIVVMVERKKAPAVGRVPRRIGGYRVEVTRVGPIRARLP